MRCITLLENTSGNADCIAEHGLCIYVETEKHKLLLDTGQTDAFLHNAEAVGVDIAAVDTVVLSHGHYDHSGGILPFCKINQTARIYMQRSAAEPHFNGERYIGIDAGIPALPNVILLDGDKQLDDELFLFTGITGRRCFPQSNHSLLMAQDGEKIRDDFRHEQCLVISQNGKKLLLSGCAHNGILNILDQYYALFGDYPDYAITGFHMMKREGEHTPDERAVIEQTARSLTTLKTQFYSGHCTGIPAFSCMKAIMGEQLHAISAGTEIPISI